MSTGSPPHAKLLSGACLHVCVAAGLRVNGNTHFEVVHDEMDVRGEVLGELLREVEALLALLLRDAGLPRGNAARCIQNSHQTTKLSPARAYHAKGTRPWKNEGFAIPEFHMSTRRSDYTRTDVGHHSPLVLSCVKQE